MITTIIKNRKHTFESLEWIKENTIYTAKVRKQRIIKNKIFNDLGRKFLEIHTMRIHVKERPQWLLAGAGRCWGGVLSGVRQFWGHIPALPLTSRIFLGKLFNLNLFFHFQCWLVIVLIHGVAWRVSKIMHVNLAVWCLVHSVQTRKSALKNGLEEMHQYVKRKRNNISDFYFFSSWIQNA